MNILDDVDDPNQGLREAFFGVDIAQQQRLEAEDRSKAQDLADQKRAIAMTRINPSNFPPSILIPRARKGAGLKKWFQKAAQNNATSGWGGYQSSPNTSPNAWGTFK